MKEITGLKDYKLNDPSEKVFVYDSSKDAVISLE